MIVTYGKSVTKFLTGGCAHILTSDGHSLIYGILRTSRPKPSVREIYYLWKRPTWWSIKSSFLCNPYTFDDVDDSFWAFDKLHKEVINDHILIKTKKVKCKNKIFVNKQLRKACMDKSRLWNKYLKCPSNKTWEAYRKQSNKTTVIKKACVTN